MGSAVNRRPSAGVVIVHDYLTQRGGAERVVLAMLRALPGSRLITSVYEPAQTFEDFQDFDVETLWPNRVPAFRRDPRLAFSVLGAAFSRYTVEDASLVLCSSSGWAHAVRTVVPKLVFCHTPPRWLYQPDVYFSRLPVSIRRGIGRALFVQRRHDQQWACSAQGYLAVSEAVRQRIMVAYGIDAPILHPPAGLAPDDATEPIAGLEPGYYLVIARPRSYKNVHSVVDVFRRRTSDRLVVVGSLPRSELRNLPANVSVLGGLTDPQMRWLYGGCRALIAVAIEDFGLTPVETYQFGKPVVALRAGGYLDTVVDGVTGVFADSAEPASIHTAIERFSELSLNRCDLASHAARFDEASFARQLLRALYPFWPVEGGATPG